MIFILVERPFYGPEFELRIEIFIF